MAVHTTVPAHRRLRQKDHEVKVSLGYRGKLHLQK